MMEKINAVITGVGGYVPDYVLTNEELSRMVDTNDEWIMTRIGVKERRILNEEGLGTSYLARKAAKQLMQKECISCREESRSMYMVEVDVTSWKDLKMRSVQLSRLTCSMVPQVFSRRFLRLPFL
jgi:hypothetical protein